ncbi:MAG: fibronectin type III domain-containing protein [Thaumarchaeota archaeon]|nr:fibronectin type III domain-containing protein [Nitrososphaerota archaeon]
MKSSHYSTKRLNSKKLLTAVIFSIFLIFLATPYPRSLAFSNNLPASVVLGQTDFSTKNPILDQPGLHFPTSSTFDSSGNLWVADSQNDRVLEFKSPFTDGEGASVVLGQTGFGQGGPHGDDHNALSNSTMNNPSGVAFDSSGNLWVADSQNDRVLEFPKADQITGGAATVVLGHTGFTSRNDDDGHLTSSSLNNPSGVAVDSLGDLSVADTGDNRILVYLVPTPPLITTASAGNATVVLSWTPPSNNEGSAIAGYDIFRGTSSGSETLLTKVGNVTTYTDTSSLAFGQTFYYEVTAINSVGESPRSNEATVMAGAVPSKVTGLTASPVSTSEIGISWNEPSGNGYGITGYMIERSNDGTNWTTIQSNAQGTSYNDTTNLLPNSLYYYRVSATNILGTGNPSDTAYATTVLLPPSNLAANTTSTSQIDLTWTSPYGTVTGYEIENSTDGANWKVLVRDTGNSTTKYSVTGLESGTLYYYRVSAINSGLTSSTSNVAAAETDLSSPGSLSAIAVADSQVNLSWTAPSGIVTGYEIDRSTDGTAWTQVVSGITATSYSDVGLGSNTVYIYRVSALGQTGAVSSPSGTASATTYPSAPTQVVAKAEAGLEMDVSWQPPSGDGVIIRYQIERSTDGITWGSPTSIGTSNTYQDSGLTAGTTYYYKVAAVNAGGTGLYSSQSSGIVGGDAPSLVTSPTVTILSGGIMELSWTAPASNGYSVSSYSVDQSTSGGTFTTIKTITGSPPATSYAVTGLDNGTSYQWRVEATNALDTSPSGTSSQTATALPPLQIEAQTVSGDLVPGAKYTISPDPSGVPNTLIDGSSGDADNKLDGTTTVNLVPFGTYNITMSSIPAGYNVLGNWTLYTEETDSLNGIMVFRLVPTTANFSQLGSTVITTPPDLNDTTLTTWGKTFHALKVNKTSSLINAVSQLPPILSAGSQNATAVNQAISSQATIQLNTTFSHGTSPLDIINTLQVPTYSMPTDRNVLSVIPSIVTAYNATNGQIVTTPPLNKIVPGQPMVIPVQGPTLPGTGGVKQIFVQSSPSSNSSGNPTSDWFVIRANQSIPSSLPALPASVNKSSTLFVNVTYSYEVSGVGFNWGNASNYAHAPNMTVTLPKPSADSDIQIYSDGCAIPAVFLFDPSTKSWTSNKVTILTESPDSLISNECDYVIQVPHFSQFGIGGLQVNSGGGADVRIYTTPPSLAVASLSPITPAMQTGGFGGILPLRDNVTQTITVGEPVSMRIDISDPQGPMFVEHVGLHTNFNGPDDQNGQTYVMYEPGQPLAVYDPGHFLSYANATESESGNNLIVTFNMTFARDMKTSDVLIRSWDQDKNAFNEVFHRALQVVTSLPQSTNTTSTATLQDNLAPRVQNMHIINMVDNPAANGQDAEQAFVFSGRGNFTYDGLAYIPFGFSTSCQKLSGYCTDSWMDIGGSRILASGFYSGTSDAPMISLNSYQLSCKLYGIQGLFSRGQNEVVFECTKPLGSGISDFRVIPQK